ncbi:MAG: 50S ribosomal protein L3 [Candidatus Taylorbacteria bacterium RIFCSPHIGHO2_02_FULL_45_28]|uniref:Large ribosomal subunit protein uL3 n=1 Tax=Candidatus Taylorbacteria bacterium RIFCSPHIGHO2_12_FULL_45_16 TaxID=1802315 RepID=A0A1G2N114_9BACT|nr:MAG: 50S ribosomal protein L3 [Candidatus Taylorbacteria bacterium RIFCSPHIGHO2_01_FULL_44_110]OHA25431.1 MAG: 50S ribosomal protein L3 [Candidatus Taylorbacteria bacterium RIFCSPHIGHO2_02_FULL_45_28]OHA29099.1 MAG: 50S ribosomal protein L3 [Candidatus Taylorbacteria bacterium RIFCSPHIGHO2_12_FULL_45_16]OHA33321.1 MAG: 50S ribosomal protein L3 [Candidatus Taylorbacteria bacterium RIFCSPLOWO2_01_FULL_45_59]OHA38927.1 MAG: 50S ribosomal protein L3 [Candidatus Taylorbacteria bacterium RIFCSPLOW
MKFILGRKLNMTQIFDASGAALPVTAVSVRSNVVTQVRTKDTDGYEALQVGEGSRNPNRIAKPQKGHFKELGSFASVREFRLPAVALPRSSEAFREGEAKAGDFTPGAGTPTPKVGDKVELSQFAAGDVVTVSAISKGKGFQGVVKRHGFGGGPRSHGQKHSEREPGSIGGGLRTRVPVGMRMAGRMGSDRITVKNLKIVHIDAEESVMYVSGAIPGRRGTLVEIVA